MNNTNNIDSRRPIPDWLKSMMMSYGYIPEYDVLYEDASRPGVTTQMSVHICKVMVGRIVHHKVTNRFEFEAVAEQSLIIKQCSINPDFDKLVGLGLNGLNGSTISELKDMIDEVAVEYARYIRHLPSLATVFNDKRIEFAKRQGGW